MGIMRVSAERAILEDAKAENKPEPPRVPDPKGATKTFLDELIRWIPGESLAIFVALMGLTADSRVFIRVGALVVAAVATPIWVRIHYLQSAKTRQAKRVWPKAQMVIATLAFVAWSTSVPKSAWTEIGDFKSSWGTGIAVLVSFAIGTFVAYWNASHDRRHWL